MQRRAERLERMLDDPYYIVDTRKPSRPPHEDVDSIPIVRLEDMPALPKGRGTLLSFVAYSLRMLWLIEQN